LLSNPIGPQGNQIVDRSYPYGGTKNDTLEPHVGVEFVNPFGAPVLAAADGLVVVAGDDSEIPYSAYPNFYGNLVVIEHTFPELDEPLFTLYGHLSEVLVEAGQSVTAGQQVGRVGLSGVALGNHLHFEVRLGRNSHLHTRNPELWLAPRLDENGQTFGALAGYILDGAGELVAVPGLAVDFLPEAGEDDLPNQFIEPYADATLNGDDLWGENFALGGLPSGSYQVSFVLGTLYRQQVQVLPGQLTLLAFCLE
jgi:hypothetical protein